MILSTVLAQSSECKDMDSLDNWLTESIQAVIAERDEVLETRETVADCNKTIAFYNRIIKRIKHAYGQALDKLIVAKRLAAFGEQDKVVKQYQQI